MPDHDLELSVDELAQRAGTTVRNVRLYQERGLLPKPERRGRKAVYSGDHLLRLQLVLRLLQRGYSLVAIKDLTEAWDRDHDVAHILGIKDAVDTRFTQEEPLVVDEDELRTMRAPGVDPDECLARDLELGIVVREGDRYRLPAPGFFTAGSELIELGLPVDSVYATAEAVLEQTRALADVFVQSFVDDVWRPFQEAGMPDDQFVHLMEMVDRMAPLAVRSTMSALGLAMQDRVDRALREDLGL